MHFFFFVVKFLLFLSLPIKKQEITISELKFVFFVVLVVHVHKSSRTNFLCNILSSEINKKIYKV